MRILPYSLIVILNFCLIGHSLAQGTRLLRDPDVGPETIAFVHANDIWLAPREGGDAFRLTSGEGAETGPSFSPDGKWIAFTGQYNGNADVFVVPAKGGMPKQLTWHPGADVVQGWTPDGKIMFQSSRHGQPTKRSRFYTVSMDGGLPIALELPQANQGEMSPDGNLIAYEEIRSWDKEWRNYRGGQAQPIGIVSTKTWNRTTTPWEGERHLEPVWLDGILYYLSERDYAANVWSYDPQTKQDKQLTRHADFDCKSMGAGFGMVVYEQGGYLHHLDIDTGESETIEINVARDLNWARPRWQDVSGGQLTNARLSPTGKRALFESRGELFTVPLDKGSWRNITNSPGVADRHAVWSPNGKQIAWFSDEGGEYGLIISDQKGNQKKRIKIDDPTFFFIPQWSPDGKKLAFTDTDYRIWVLDVESEQLTHVDTDRYAHPQRSMNPVWSPDSNWLAYSRRRETQLRTIVLYDVAGDKKHELTDGMADSISPVWDESGKYLYFLASVNFGLNIGWLDMTSYDRPITRTLYVAILDSEESSPFLPVSDEEEIKEDKKDDQDSQTERKQKPESETDAKPESESEAIDQDEKKPDGETSDAEKDSEATKKNDDVLKIDFQDIHLRILSAPGMRTANYLGLENGPKGQVFVFESKDGQPNVLHKYSVKDQKAKEFAEGVTSAAVSHDRKKILMRTGGNWTHSDTGGPKAGTDRVNVSGIRLKVEPKAEYEQMLREGWRFMRDFLYVDNAHGAPWDDVWQWYSPWLADVNHRSDFNYLLDIVSGEIAVGHSYVVGGDYPDLEFPRTGLLGCDFEIANGGLRIKKIYRGGNWTPNVMGPLSAHGLGVKEGCYLVAINGTPIDKNSNPYELLEGTAGRTITISVADSPDSDDAKEVAVRPTSSESSIRTWEWVESNQRRVDELSDGRLAYVWLPNTGQGGYTYFNRMYFAQQDREGVVLDERNNGGGSAADYIIEVLERELTGYFNSRANDRKPFTQPMAGLFGPKVMIINESAGSGGDLLPYLFRFKKLGPLVGTRTWGGLVGTWDTPPLLDGGRFVAPRGGFIDVDGNWSVEGEGVAPDIEVRNDPQPVIEGGDPQLEAAVAKALELLKTEKVELKPEPAPPIRAFRPGNGPK